MKKASAALLFFMITATTGHTQLKVSNLLTENRIDPIGLDVSNPRFSWQLISDKRNVMQTAYEIKLAEGKQTLWSSGKVLSDSSAYVAYIGANHCR